MNPANKNSSCASAATSTTPAASETPGNLSEADYLHRQAEFAAKAFSRAARDLADDVRQLVSPAVWTRRHPKTAVGMAVAAGAVAATLLGRRQAKPAADNHSTPADPSAAAKPKATLWSALGMELLAITKPMLSQLLAQAVQRPRPPENGHGRPSEMPAAETR